MLTFEEKLLKARNEIKVRVLTRRIYDAIDKMNEAFAEIDAVKKGLRSLEAKQLKENKKDA